MRLRPFINLILFICVVALTFLLVNGDKEKPIRQGLTLTEVNPDHVHHIQIERRNLDDILFQKQAGYWHMQSPFNLPAHPSRIAAMLKLLHAHSYDHFSAADNDLSPFMLDSPVVSIIFDELRIAFGNTNPLDAKLRYVLVKDSVHIINDALYHQLQATATFFLSPKILPPSATIKAIHLPTQTLSNIAVDEASNATAEITNAWADIKAIAIRKYEPTEPIGSIKVDLANGDTVEFVIVSDLPNLVLAHPSSGVQYYISNTDAARLFPKISE